MAGHFREHDVVGGTGIAAEVLIAEGFEFGGELLIGHSTRVLQFAQTLVGKEMQIPIGDDFFEGTAAVVGFGMLGIGEPTKEILRRIIERFLDEMVTETVVRFAFAVDEDLTLSVEDLAHKDVA